MLKNWKTTLGGVGAGLAGIAQIYLAWYNNQPIPWESAFAFLSIGWGLIKAKDHNVTGSK